MHGLTLNANASITLTLTLIEVMPDGACTETCSEGTQVSLDPAGTVMGVSSEKAQLSERQALPRTAQEFILEGVGLNEPMTTAVRHTGERYETWPGTATRTVFPDGPVKALITFSDDGSKVEVQRNQP